jgi:hypothetical protein
VVLSHKFFWGKQKFQNEWGDLVKLLETNFSGVLTEALSAHVQVVAASTARPGA